MILNLPPHEIQQHGPLGGVRTPFGMGWQSCEGEITEIIFQVCMNYL
jgi:hypothetical protein